MFFLKLFMILSNMNNKWFMCNWRACHVDILVDLSKWVIQFF